MAWLKAAALTGQALVLMLVIKAALAIMPYRRVVRFLPRPGTRQAGGWIKTRTARALQRASRWLPSATCLPQALAGSVMLASQGYDARVRIGVAPNADGPFRAHAWLVCGDDVIVGDSENLADFAVLTDLRGAVE